MKTPLFLLLCFGLLTPAFSQIHFEAIPPPVDFNLSHIRKSPTGERFVQAYNKRWSIYNSFDAETWEETALPGIFLMEDMRFFADGTPLFITQNNGPHLIRRQGEWYSMSLPGASQSEINASFIREDSLFVYQDGQFAYSLDKGVSFEELFTQNFVLDGAANGLWKLGPYFVLSASAGLESYLYAFGPSGQLLLEEVLENVNRPEQVYNNCGELLFLAEDAYYLLKAGDLSLESGEVESFFPAYEGEAGQVTYSRNGSYYRRQGDTVYRTSACSQDWAPMLSDPIIGQRRYFWVDEEENLFFYSRNRDQYLLYSSEEEALTEQHLPIDWSATVGINESLAGHQIAISTNELFSKELETPVWTKVQDKRAVETEYSPDGSLYARFLDGQVLRSPDDGNTFESISAPQVHPLGSFLEAPENEVVILVDELMVTAHYTLDQGQNWVSVQLGIGVGGSNQSPAIRKSGDYIYLMRGSNNLVLHRINTMDGTIETVLLNDLIAVSQSGRQWAVSGDGTVYFWAAGMGNPSGLFRYRWEQGVEYLASEEELDGSYALLAVGNQLFGLSGERVFLYEDGIFVEFGILGLPENLNEIKYHLSESGHLYAIVDDHFIFRSDLPLEGQMPTSTRGLKHRQTVAVYPNPAKEVLFLDIGLDELRQVEQAEILDPLGRPAQSWQHPDSNRLDISGLQPGLYYLQLRQDGRLHGRAAFVKR